MVNPLGRPIRELTDPLALRVHPVIDAPNEPAELPVYLRRRHDEILSTFLGAAQERPVMVTIVGESSTGKTRAAYEAVCNLPSDWNLYYPIAPSKPKALIDALHSDRLIPKTVLWLDELREYLIPTGGEEAAAHLHDFLQRTGPFMVVATIWPQDWSLLTTDPTPEAAAPYPQARDLMRSVAHRIDIDATFDQAELVEAVRNDSRMRQAYHSTTEHNQITQYLAAGFALTEWYATIGSEYPGAWAIVTACMDAHRFGHPEPVTEEFLGLAAPRYLTREIWGALGSDWLSKALQISTQTLRGAARPLTRIRSYPDEEPQSVRYELADYLAQQGRIKRHTIFPPISFWNAATNELDDPAAQVRLGFSAADRGRLWYGALLGKKALELTEPTALRHWADILWRNGNKERAEVYLRKAAELGDVEALDDLAYYLSDSGEEAQVVELYEQAVMAGEPDSLRNLAHYLWGRGNREKADELYARAIEAGDAWSRWWWAEDLQSTGEHDQIVELCRKDATSAPPDLSLWWIPTLFEVGRAELAEELIAGLTGSSQKKEALWRWAEQLWGRNRRRAEELFQQAVDAGDENALRRWGGMLEKSGEFTRAKELLLQAATTGDDTSLWWLANMLWCHGQREQAEKFFVLAANAGCWADVSMQWEENLREIGANREAEHLRRFGLTCEGGIAEPWSLGELDARPDR
jgi:tetratricopeptide (TPR) repeat protein